ncbi:hypothetical protein DLREEDagrD3_15910 [Denitratisoma sp. agr-D3]
MPTFQNFSAETARLETEIARKGVIIGIDWDNPQQVRDLARQALACTGDKIGADCDPQSPEGRAKIELFGLAQLMLKVMAGSADEGLLSHGGQVWKTFAKALWAEMAARPESTD